MGIAHEYVNERQRGAYTTSVLHQSFGLMFEVSNLIIAYVEVDQISFNTRFKAEFEVSNLIIAYVEVDQISFNTRFKAE